MGRPSLYTPELVETIAERLSKGEPMAQICRDEGMPATRTVRDWMDAYPPVAAAIARAREDGFDALAEQCLEIADAAERDTYTDREGNERTDNEVIQRAKLRVETRLKLLAKWDPKRYGDKVQLAGHDGGELKQPPPIAWTINPVVVKE